jgi:hypothetical protein
LTNAISATEFYERAAKKTETRSHLPHTITALNCRNQLTLTVCFIASTRSDRHFNSRAVSDSLAGRAVLQWIKQNLRIKRFFGTSENAVKTQAWIALTVYVLVAIVRKRLGLSVSLHTMLQILSVTPFEKQSLLQLLKDAAIVESASGAVYVADRASRHTQDRGWPGCKCEILIPARLVVAANGDVFLADGVGTVREIGRWHREHGSLAASATGGTAIGSLPGSFSSPTSVIVMRSASGKARAQHRAMLCFR